MAKKSFLVLVMAFMAMIVGLNYSEVHAWSEATVGFDASGGKVATVCKACNGCIDSRDYQAGATSLDCQSGPNANGSQVNAHVSGNPPFSALVADALKIDFGDWGQGLVVLGPQPEFLETYDTVQVSMSIPTPETQLNIQSRLRINFECPNLWSRFEVEVKDVSTSPPTRIYYGYAYLTGSPQGGYVLQGNVPGTVQQEGIWYVAVFDHDEAFTFEGDVNDLRVWVKTFGSANLGPAVPTLTQWGAIILVALLIASAVFIMLRRRKATVPA
jgi:hypothetical protein